MKALITFALLFGVAAFSSNVRAGQWHYDTSTDKMSMKKQQTATIRSENSLHLGFPYSGENYGRLIVRKHPQYGLDVIVTVQEGQILCDVYTCNLKVRFDDRSVENFTMAPSADHSSTTVFSKYPEWAIKHLRDANEIFVQVPMYQEGNQVLEFRTGEALVWPPK